MSDEIERGLARISRRIEARQRELRERLETVPELAALMEGWKATFGPLRVEHVRIGDWSHGEPPPPGIVPAPYHPPQASRRGKAAALRAREAVGQ